MNRIRLLVVAVSLGFACLGARAADWPQWRGPQRNGISQEKGLLGAWPAEGPKLLWQLTDIGSGYSTPAIVAGRLYVLGNRGMDDEFVLALDAATGKQLWSTRLGKVGLNMGPQYPGARSTPTVDGDVLYALGSDGDLACLETASGKELWHKNLRSDFNGQPGKWAYAESPLVDGAHLICTPGGKQATLVALDKKAGSVVWKSAVPTGDQAAYASPQAVDVGGGREYVQFLQNGVVGVDAKTGQFLWNYGKTATGSPANIPTPVAGAGFIYSATGKGGCGLIHLKPGANSVAVDEVYFRKDLPSTIGGAVLVDGRLYGTTPRGLVCAEFATGKVLWQDECIGPGSILYADGRLYLHGENNGQAALVEASPEAYRERGRFTPPGQPERGKAKAWAYPVVANGKFYLRDQGTLWCYDVQAR
jgi:outer membrane protein assembly factor BamB